MGYVFPYIIKLFHVLVNDSYKVQLNMGVYFYLDAFIAINRIIFNYALFIMFFIIWAYLHFKYG